MSREPFAMLPDSAICDQTLSNHALRVLALILRYAGPKGGSVSHSQTEMADRLGCTRQHVSQSIRELRAKGYLVNLELTCVKPALTPDADVVKPALTDAQAGVDEPVKPALTPSLLEKDPEETHKTRGPQRERHLPIDDAFRDAMVAKYQGRLGGEQAVRDCMVEAENHRAMDKAKDHRIYLDRWLARQITFGRANGTGYARQSQANPDGELRRKADPGSRGPGAFAAFV